MAQGYIYVLANSSMVNIGKTTRQPSLRAQELSSVTGVPTPFIVIYERVFNDCDAAEVFIHELLSIKGYRVSENREFFNAPANEVIDSVLKAVSLDEAVSPVIEDDEKEYFDSVIDESLDELCLTQDKPLPVWWDIWHMRQLKD